MKFQAKGALIFLISLIWVQPIFSGAISNSSDTIKWTCLCSTSQMNQSTLLQSNCSSSCNCSAVDGSNGDQWFCTCDDNGLPKLASQGQDPTCFSGCNCTSGTLSNIPVPEKHQSNKIVVLTLLICVVLTTIAFLSSITCYFYRKEKCQLKTPVFSPEREISCNSATNLITKVTSSEKKISISSPINSLTGCFHNGCYVFKVKSETEIRHVTIYKYPYSELEYATNNFSNSNLIGVGGSSHVYRGQLRNGRIVAIKRLKDRGGTDADSVFSSEVDLLSRLNHCHVVPLLGYCSEFQGKHIERLLIFEYISNGNLRDCLDSDFGENMNWETRVAIAIGAARGLEYLHEAAAPRILHRDVKSTNILLDENWRAKITDLGMAKYLKPDGPTSCNSSPARMQGTFGYFAPEYAIVGRASLKSDVFSFGVVLLELITGRQPIHKSTNKGVESLVIWATPCLQDSRQVISELPDPRLKGKFPQEEMQIMAYLAKECLLLDPDSRPTMSEVVQILSTITPDKSRTRNIHADLFQLSASNLSRAETTSKVIETQAESPVEAEELWNTGSERWSMPHSFSVNIDQALEIETSVKPQKVELSSNCMESLILLSSKSRSWRVQEDEAVDLVEPRFESFSVANLKFP